MINRLEMKMIDGGYENGWWLMGNSQLAVRISLRESMDDGEQLTS